MAQSGGDIELAEAGFSSALAETFAQAVEGETWSTLLCLDEFTLQVVEDAIEAVARVASGRATQLLSSLEIHRSLDRSLNELY